MDTKPYLSIKADHRYLFSGIVILAACILLALIFRNVISQPREYLFSAGGDGVKNYYTCIYYVLNDSGTLFTGMNYPYGENVVFTDNQPILSWLIKLYHSNISPLTPAGIIGILNSVMLFSIAAGAYFIYKILRKNLLPVWYSVCTALLIVFLSPQLQRLLGHYALSYTFVIPALWYIAIRISESKRSIIPYSLYLGTTLLCGFIHPYYLLISAFFLLTYTFIHFFQNLSERKTNLFYLTGSILSVALPIVLFQLWLGLTSPVSDRPSSPYGFLIYRSSFESVFYPTESPFREFWQTAFKSIEPIWEGYAYVGLIGLVTLILTAVLAVRYLIKVKLKYILRPVLPVPLQTGIWAATLILLFSCGVPFIYNLESLLDFLPPLKQFRSIGRFAWIFYYIYSVYAAFYFYRLFRYLKVKKLSGFAYSFIGFVLLVWALDTRLYLTPKVKTIKDQKVADSFSTIRSSYSDFLATGNRYASDFQAIIPLPYFHLGSELFAIEGGGAIYEAMKASVNLQLPLSAVMMSRTSFDQTIKSIQLVSSEHINKKILTDLPSDKPFLVLVTKDGLRAQEVELLKKAKKLVENEWVSLYELPVSALQSTHRGIRQSFEEKRSTMHRSGDAYTSKPGAAPIIKGFTSENSHLFLFDKGSKKVQGSLKLFEGNLPDQADTTFEASVWVYANAEKGLGVLKYRQYNPEKQLVEEKETLVRHTVDVFEGWVRPGISFKLQHPANTIEVFFEGEANTLDNFMLRAENNDVYYHTADGKNFIFNNFLIENATGR